MGADRTERQKAPSLPANHAFVVQFRSQAEGGKSRYAGRVEHLTSGQAAHFSSWADLQQFIAQVLARLEKEDEEER